MMRALYTAASGMRAQHPVNQRQNQMMWDRMEMR